MIEQLACYFGKIKPLQEDIDKIQQYPQINIIKIIDNQNFFCIVFQHIDLLNVHLLQINNQWAISKNNTYTIL